VRALTIQQPWAQCVAERGPTAKRVENRGRVVRYRGEVAIHAGERWSKRGQRDWRVQRLLWSGRDLDDGATGFFSLGHAMGAVIAVARIVDCHPAVLVSTEWDVGEDADEACCWPWGDLTYAGQRLGERCCNHVVLDDVRPLADPVPAKGALGLWTLPCDVEAAVRAQLATVPG
jgi:hypothetical protein